MGRIIYSLNMIGVIPYIVSRIYLLYITLYVSRGFFLWIKYVLEGIFVILSVRFRLSETLPILVSLHLESQ